jgi:hypothetical protein
MVERDFSEYWRYNRLTSILGMRRLQRRSSFVFGALSNPLSSMPTSSALKRRNVVKGYTTLREQPANLRWLSHCQTCPETRNEWRGLLPCASSPQTFAGFPLPNFSLFSTLIGQFACQELLLLATIPALLICLFMQTHVCECHAFFARFRATACAARVTSHRCATPTLTLPKTQRETHTTLPPSLSLIGPGWIPGHVPFFSCSGCLFLSLCFLIFLLCMFCKDHPCMVCREREPFLQ